MPIPPVFDFGNNPVRRVDVNTSVRMDNFLRVGMRPVHGDARMIVTRVLVQGVEGLVPGQSHSPEKKADHPVHLFTGGLIVFLP